MFVVESPWFTKSHKTCSSMMLQVVGVIPVILQVVGVIPVILQVVGVIPVILQVVGVIPVILQVVGVIPVILQVVGVIPVILQVVGVMPVASGYVRFNMVCGTKKMQCIEHHQEHCMPAWVITVQRLVHVGTKVTTYSTLPMLCYKSDVHHCVFLIKWYIAFYQVNGEDVNVYHKHSMYMSWTDLGYRQSMAVADPGFEVRGAHFFSN